MVHNDSVTPGLQKALGAEINVRRASHVEPEAKKSPTEVTTWEADLAPSAGPKVGGFPTRAEAIRFEIGFLENQLLTQ